MSAYRTIDFIGLGVGEPICRNLVKKSGAAVIAFDLAPFGAPACRRCLGRGFGRGSRHQRRHRVRKTRARGVRRRWHAVRKDQIVVDLGTSSVNQTRDFARQLQAALAEAVAVAKSNGVDPALLLDTLSKGSADSFALRNHGMKAIVPGNFPDRAFSTEYALKDLPYALELAGDAGIKIRGAELIGQILREAIDAGSGEAYFPVIAKHIGSGP